MSPNQRADFAMIANWIPAHSRVLDLGCGDGGLLKYLQENKQTRGYGIDINAHNIRSCTELGISVIQTDLEAGLSMFETGTFDYVILSQTLQAMRHVAPLLQEMLRVGKQGIVSFPNFGYWKNRWQQLVLGKMPVSDTLPYQWYDTPNIHLCTVKDFEILCSTLNIHLLDKRVTHDNKPVTFAENWRGSLAFFAIESIRN